MNIKYEPGDRITFRYQYIYIGTDEYSALNRGYRVNGNMRRLGYEKINHYLDITNFTYFAFTQKEINNESIQLDIVKTNHAWYYYIPNPCQKTTSYVEMLKVLDK